MEKASKKRDWTWGLCLIIALSLLYPRFRQGQDNLPGIPPVDGFDSTETLARIAETLNGHTASGSALLLEHAGDPLTKGSFWEPLFGHLGHLFGLEILTLYWLVTLAGCTIGLFVLSRLARELGLKAPLDLGVAAAVIAFCLDQRLFRVIQPQWTWPLFVLWILWLIRWSQQPDRRQTFILGVLTIVQVYSYPHFGVMAIGTLVFYGSYAAFKRREAMSALGLVGVALLAAIPLLLSTRSLADHEAFGDLVWRMGFASSKPVFPLTWAALAGLLAVSRLPTKVSGPLFCLALAALVGVNLQVVTGYEVSSARYVWYLMRPLAALIGLCLAFTWFDLRRTIMVGLTAGLVVISITRVAGHGSQWFEVRTDRHRQLRQAKPVFEALRRLPKRSVVACGPDSVGAWIPALTGHRLYNSLMTHTQLLTRDEFEHRQHEGYLLSGRTLPDLAHGYEKDPSNIAATFFGNHYHVTRGGNQFVPAKECERVILDHARWRSSLKDAIWVPRWQCDYLIQFGDSVLWTQVNASRVESSPSSEKAYEWELVKLQKPH